MDLKIPKDVMATSYHNISMGDPKDYIKYNKSWDILIEKIRNQIKSAWPSMVESMDLIHTAIMEDGKLRWANLIMENNFAYVGVDSNQERLVVWLLPKKKEDYMVFGWDDTDEDPSSANLAKPWCLSVKDKFQEMFNKVI